MKHKLLKRIFILTQVLGLSALAATACTDNNSNSSAKTSASTSSATATAQVKTEETNQPTDSNQNLQQNPEHKDNLKQKAIKVGAKGLKVVGDAAILGAAAAASINNPAGTLGYAKAAKEAISKVNHKVDNAKNKKLAAEEAKKNDQEHDENKHKGHHAFDSIKKLADKAKSAVTGHSNDQGNTKP